VKKAKRAFPPRRDLEKDKVAVVAGRYRATSAVGNTTAVRQQWIGRRLVDAWRVGSTRCGRWHGHGPFQAAGQLKIAVGCTVSFGPGPANLFQLYKDSLNIQWFKL
jgi:hypothetical protein